MSETNSPERTRPHSTHSTPASEAAADRHRARHASKGEMVFDSSARILGTFEGRITGGEVEIGEGAGCKASIGRPASSSTAWSRATSPPASRCQLNIRAPGSSATSSPRRLWSPRGAVSLGTAASGPTRLQAAPARRRPSTPPAAETSRRNKPVVVAQVGSSSRNRTRAAPT